ncbi:hypothetical protein RUND412_005823 [Rhizina undulata]
MDAEQTEDHGASLAAEPPSPRSTRFSSVDSSLSPERDKIPSLAKLIRAALKANGRWIAHPPALRTVQLEKSTTTRILVFRGAFNPPHIGHLETLKAALEAGKHFGIKAAIIVAGEDKSLPGKYSKHAEASGSSPGLLLLKLAHRIKLWETHLEKTPELPVWVWPTQRHRFRAFRDEMLPTIANQYQLPIEFVDLYGSDHATSERLSGNPTIIVERGGYENQFISCTSEASADCGETDSECCSVKGSFLRYGEVFRRLPESEGENSEFVIWKSEGRRLDPGWYIQRKVSHNSISSTDVRKLLERAMENATVRIKSETVEASQIEGHGPKKAGRYKVILAEYDPAIREELGKVALSADMLLTYLAKLLKENE